MITTVKLINISSLHRVTTFLYPMSALEVYSLSIFPVSTTVFLSIGIPVPKLS